MSIFSNWLSEHIGIPQHKFTTDDIIRATKLIHDIEVKDWTEADANFLEQIAGANDTHIIKTLIEEIETLRDALVALRGTSDREL